MRTIPFLFAVVAVMLTSNPAGAQNPPPSEGVAIAIIYDTSGSMRDRVKDSKGNSSPKYLVANRALSTIAGNLEKYVASRTNSGFEIHTALFTFRGNSAQQTIAYGPLNAKAIRDWANNFSQPGGDTPLGNSLSAAWACLLDSKLPRKHVLVITDGMNTAGPDPARVLPQLKNEAAQKGAAVSVHFVAFDIAAKVFDGVKKQGATVLAAADEAQLNAQLDFILRKRILLEDE